MHEPMNIKKNLNLFVNVNDLLLSFPNIVTLTDSFDILYHTFEMFIKQNYWFYKEVKRIVYLTETFPRPSTPPCSFTLCSTYPISS